MTILDSINQFDCLLLPFILIMLAIGNQFANPDQKQRCKALAFLIFIMYFVYALVEFQPTGGDMLAGLALRGVLAFGVAYSVLLIVFALVDYCLRSTVGRGMEWRRRREAEMLADAKRQEQLQKQEAKRQVAVPVPEPLPPVNPFEEAKRVYELKCAEIDKNPHIKDDEKTAAKEVARRSMMHEIERGL